jgi:hypothetical protein
VRRKHTNKIKLATPFKDADRLQVPSPVGILVRFAVVLHPQRGTILLMCTGLTLPPLEVIRIDGQRFKDRSVLKAGPPRRRHLFLSLWMAAMTPTARERQPAPAPQIGGLTQRRRTYQSTAMLVCGSAANAKNSHRWLRSPLSGQTLGRRNPPSD